jgi:hypothetical protein
MGGFMLKDLFEALREHLTKQETVLPVELKWAPRMGRSVAFWNPKAKEVDFLDGEPPMRRHKVRTIESLISYINADQEPVGKRRVVWFGEKRIVADLDEVFGNDVLEMELAYSPTWTALENLVRSPSVTQLDAIKLLRQRFAGHGDALQALTAARSLRLKKTEDFDSEQSHDMSRIGKSVAKEAVGASQLPESITVDATVFADGSEVSSIKVWTSINFERNTIDFEPDQLAMDNAKKAARAEYLSVMRKGMKALVYEGEYCVAS